MTPYEARRYRLTGPVGLNLAELAASRLFAAVQHHVTFEPGDSVEAAAALLGSSPVWAPGGGSRVFTVYADFPYPWRSEADEVRAYEAGEWHPGNRDFEALARSLAASFSDQNHGIRKVASLADLLFALIAHPVGSIGRLNIITHGSGSGFGLSGTVIPGDVELGLDIDSPRHPKSDDDITFIDSSELAKLDECNSTDCARRDLEFRRGSLKTARTVTFQDALARFSADAYLYLYACKGGSADTQVLQRLADAFNLRVWSFKQELWYFPEIVDGRIRDRTWCQYPRLSGARVQGLQNLKPDNFAQPGASAAP